MDARVHAVSVLPQTENPLLISRLEAGRLLGCSDRHVDKLASLGLIRMVSAGRRRMAVRASLEEFVRTGVADSSGETCKAKQQKYPAGCAKRGLRSRR